MEKWTLPKLLPQYRSFVLLDTTHGSHGHTIQRRRERLKEYALNSRTHPEEQQSPEILGKYTFKERATMCFETIGPKNDFALVGENPPYSPSSTHTSLLPYPIAKFTLRIYDVAIVGWVHIVKGNEDCSPSENPYSCGRHSNLFHLREDIVHVRLCPYLLSPLASSFPVSASAHNLLSSTSTITTTSNSTPLHVFPSSNSSPDNTSSAPPPPTSPIGGRCHSVAFTQPSFFFHCPGALSSTTSRVICGLEPISQPLNIAINGIAADLRAVAIEISQRRSFQDRYASDLQAVLDAGESLHKRTRKVSFVPPPMYEDATIPISPTRSFPQCSAQPTILAPSSPTIEFKNIVVNEVLSAAYHKLASVLPPPPSMSPSPSSCSPPPPPPVTDPSSLYSLIRLVLPQTFHM
ncbi:hypothetical protein JOM56_011734 [Amanita muscaria]